MQMLLSSCTLRPAPVCDSVQFRWQSLGLNLPGLKSDSDALFYSRFSFWLKFYQTRDFSETFTFPSQLRLTVLQ